MLPVSTAAGTLRGPSCVCALTTRPVRLTISSSVCTLAASTLSVHLCVMMMIKDIIIITHRCRPPRAPRLARLEEDTSTGIANNEMLVPRRLLAHVRRRETGCTSPMALQALQCRLQLRAFGGLGQRSEQRDDQPQPREQRRVGAGISVLARRPIDGLRADAQRPAQADATTIRPPAHPSVFLSFFIAEKFII
jgi:hypothetical protein